MKGTLVPISEMLTGTPCCSVTAWHRGGGVKRLYRLLDFHRQPAAGAITVEHIEYDPNRSARIALTQQVQGELTFPALPHHHLYFNSYKCIHEALQIEFWRSTCR